MSLLANMRRGLESMVGGLPRSYWTLWAGTLVNRTGSFVLPFLAIYLTQVRHFPLTTAGLVASLYGLGVAVASPLGGFLADHVGRRKTMLGALTCGGLGMMAMGFAHSLAVIAPGAFLLALVGEMYRPAMQATMADVVPMKDRVRAFGLLYWAINLGFSIGLSLGGLLATKSFLLLFLGDGATSLVFAFLIWRGVPESRPAPAAHAEGTRAHGLVSGFLAPYRDRPFLAFVLLSVAIAIVFMQHVTALAIDMTAHGVSRAAFGAIIALNGVIIVIAQPFLGPFVARFNRSRVIAAGTTLFAIGFGLNAVAHQVPMYALSVAVWTIGEICVLPVANAVVADIALPQLRGRYQGAYGITFGIATFVAPVLGTFVLQHFGSAALWLGCFAVGLAVTLGHLALEPALTRLRAERRAAHA